MVSNEHSSLQCYSILMQSDTWSRGQRVEPGPEGGVSVGTESDTGANKFQLPNLVLAIEEPELYQHPSRQRHLASVLLNLAEGALPGVAKNTQVIYTTHSPLFVGLDR